MKRDPQPAGPPPEFLAKMRRLLPADEYERFLAGYDRPPRVGLRVNTLKISVDEFSSKSPFSLAPAGVGDPAAFLVTDDSRPGRHPYHDAGLYYLQEPSAMVAATLLAPQAGELVLDLAAAPGGKATHLASLMAGLGEGPPLPHFLDAPGLLVANDVHAGRARLLAENLARWGATQALVTQDEPERLQQAFGPIFDRVLVDAPCSGEGMFRRQEGIEWSEPIVAACARRQQGIIDTAAGLVRPGGRLLYATCTFSPEENEQVIAGFLSRHPQFSLEEPPRPPGAGRGRPEWTGEHGTTVTGQLSRAVRLWPHQFSGEGHFLALLRRAGDAAETPRVEIYPVRPLAAADWRLWRDFAGPLLTVELPRERLLAHNGRLYLLPATTLATGRLHLVRYGLLLGELRRGYFRPAHDLALALDASGAGRAVTWDAADPRLAAYLAGEDVADPGPDGWTLVTVEGYGLGWAKRVAGQLKNHYPRNLRRPGG